MKKYDIVSIGTALQDIIFYTDKAELLKNPKPDPTKLKFIGFEYGAKINSPEVDKSFGGGASNTAVGMARLGLNNAALVNAGNDNLGKELIQHLRKEGVDTKLVQQDKYQATGFSFLVIEKKTNEHVVFAHYGANQYLNITPKLLKSFSTQWFYISSLSMKNWFQSLERVVTTKAKIAWNPGSIQLASSPNKLKKLLPAITVLIVNKDEATELAIKTGFKMKGKRIVNTKLLAKHLYSLGPTMILITNSRKGAHVYDGVKFYFQKPKHDKPKDTTGAGDCFGSSFITGLIKFSDNIPAALQLATLNATALVSQTGAQKGLLKWQQISKNFKHLKP